MGIFKTYGRTKGYQFEIGTTVKVTDREAGTYNKTGVIIERKNNNHNYNFYCIKFPFILQSGINNHWIIEKKIEYILCKDNVKLTLLNCYE